MRNKQAVLETSRGTIVIELLPQAAPNHVGYFMKLAREGAYAGTTFHRAVKLGIIQGGDPLTKDPAKRALYGTGGLGVLKAEISQEPMTAGAVAAVTQPNKPDSAGAQFFIAVTDQPALTGQFTVFGRVAEGLESRAADLRSANRRSGQADRSDRDRRRDDSRRAAARAGAVFQRVCRRSRAATALSWRPPAARSRSSSCPTRRPSTCATSCDSRAAGVYDGTSFHRVVKGFVVQTGMVSTRTDAR